MHAMVLTSPRTPLEWLELPDRDPGPDEIRVTVGACGVCRTDLHVVDGELTHPKLPLVPGHEVVGRIDAMGASVELGLKIGERVGIPWLAHTCGICSFCIHGHENLCDDPQFTGYTRDGGFATSVIANARYAFPLPADYADAALAPRALLEPKRDASPPRSARPEAITRVLARHELWPRPPPPAPVQLWVDPSQVALWRGAMKKTFARRNA